MLILTCSTIFLFYLSICNAGSKCPATTDLTKCKCVGPTFSTDISITDESTTKILSEDKLLNEINSIKDLAFGELANAYTDTVLACGEPAITTFSELESDLSKFRFQIIDKLILKSIPMANSKEKTLKFPSSLFQDIRIREIEISKTRLSPGFITTGIPFDNQITLRVLSVKDCDLQGPLTYDSCGTVLTKNLEKTSSLKELDLSGNFITCVSSTAFSNPPSRLSKINLSNNDISYVFPGAFKKVSRLQSIDLSNNFIQFQPKDIFPNPATYLEEINLESNSIKSLPEDFFSNMPNLTHVNLKDNRLHSMPEKVWSGIWSQLTKFYITGNIIECDCHLLWMVNSKKKPGREIEGSCMNYDVPDSYNLKDLDESQLACSAKYL